MGLLPLCLKLEDSNALYGEMAWQPPHVKQWKSVANQWHRLKSMDCQRINSKIFTFCCDKSSSRCKNWEFLLKNHMLSINMLQTLELCTSMSRKSFCDKVLQGTMGNFISVWRNSIQNDVGTSGRGRNKLRT